jgi:NAD(P)H-flavin reductase
MEEHIVKVLHTEYLTHDVKRLTVQRPENYHFKSGQATEVSVNKRDWKNKKRSFTFTSLDSWKNLEFTIKIYEDHKDVTEQIGKLREGEELILHDVLGCNNLQR